MRVNVYVQTKHGMDVYFRYVRTIEVVSGCHYINFAEVPKFAPFCEDFNAEEASIITRKYEIQMVSFSALHVIIIESEELLERLSL